MIADEPGDEEVWGRRIERAAVPLRRRRLQRLRLRARRRRTPRRDHRHGRARRLCPRSTTTRNSQLRVAARRAAPARRKPAPSPRARVAAQPPPRRDRSSRPSRTRPTRRTSRPPRAVTPSGDDLTTRIITGAVLAAVALLAFVIGPRRHRGARHRDRRRRRVRALRGLPSAGFQPATLLALLGSASMVGIAYNHGERAFPLVTAVVVAFTLFLVPGQGRARPADGQRRGHDLRVHLRRHPGRVRGPAASCSPTVVGMIIGPRAVRGELRRRRLHSSARGSATDRSCPTCRPTRPSRAWRAAWPRRW